MSMSTDFPQTMYVHSVLYSIFVFIVYVPIKMPLPI